LRTITTASANTRAMSCSVKSLWSSMTVVIKKDGRRMLILLFAMTKSRHHCNILHSMTENLPSPTRPHRSKVEEYILSFVRETFSFWFIDHLLGANGGAVVCHDACGFFRFCPRQFMC
jgi:hypothetical protein